MLALMLNPGKKRKSRKSRKGRARSSRRGKSAVARKAVKRFACAHSRWLPGGILRRYGCGKKYKVKAAESVLGPTWAYKSTGDNPKHRRRRRRNCGSCKSASFNYRAKRRNSTWLPAFANPMVKDITAGFDVGVLSKTLPVIGGFLGGKYLNHIVGGLGFLPSMVKSGPGALALGLLNAGALGAGVKMIAPNQAAPVMLGAVIQVISSAAQQYIMPLFGMKPLMTGMDYLTVADARQARALSYLTVANARNAQPLGDYGEDAELAALSCMNEDCEDAY